MKKALLLPLAIALTSPALAAPKLDVTSVQLKTYLTTAMSNVEDVPDGAVIRMTPATCYGWAIRFAPVDAQLDIVERLKLPASAPNWNSGDNVKVDRNRRRGTSQLRVDGSSGAAANGWCVAEGDPQGLYKFKIKYRRKTIAKLRFHLTSLAPPQIKPAS